MSRNHRASDILADLADAALMQRFCRDGVSETYDKPGQIIERLSSEERAKLAELKPEDTANARWPRPEGINLEKMPRRLK